ncbi:hypothetical protein G3N59_11690 [Paraburkholderia sp. Ac-20340]|uniref:hypothetical protein n=1 Tax=Paraburkholderia sp. Ac-20340 TaxID=2703888 RepID=UPI00197D48FC|nr:hypothetical protein [Paraburkholderia sp. Ac-20340]MBN3854042.1 hypothetical protein [Paraburkholderia sp. Ac-20340]
MKLSVGGISKEFENSKYVLYLFLAFAPLYMRPLGFVGAGKPTYTKLKGLWTTPFAGAALAVGGGSKLLQWIYFQQASVVAKDGSAFRQMAHIVNTGSQTLFALTVGLIYGVAILRWGYHLAASTVCRHWGIQAARVPLLYFVVTTATFGFWLGVMVWAMGWLCEHWDARVEDLVTTLPVTHPGAILLMLLCFGAMLRWASFNGDAGFRQVYGNSAKLASFVQLAPACLAFAILYVFARP